MDSRSNTNADSMGEEGEAGSQPFTLTTAHVPPIPIVIAAPHGGRNYPVHVIQNMRESTFSRIRLEDRLIDTVAGDVARQTGASLLVASAPRAVLDLNRSKNDVDWGMIEGPKPTDNRVSHKNRRARSGLGLVPRRLPNFGEIWRHPLSQEELDERIEQIHKPYHRALGKEMERLRDHWGAALLVDLHSMPPLKKRYGMPNIARFVLGDRFGASCDPGLSGCVLQFLERKRSPISHNRPYAGGYILDQHAAPRRGLHAMQLEVCRTLYLDPSMAELSEGAKPLADMLAIMVRELGALTARLGDRGIIPQAAE